MRASRSRWGETHPRFTHRPQSRAANWIAGLASAHAKLSRVAPILLKCRELIRMAAFLHDANVSPSRLESFYTERTMPISLPDIQSHQNQQATSLADFPLISFP
jgi:hypothetical protein